MKTLAELIDYLERSCDRAESDDWTALTLSVKEAQELLPELKRAFAVDWLKRDEAPRTSRPEVTIDLERFKREAERLTGIPRRMQVVTSKVEPT